MHIKKSLFVLCLMAASVSVFAQGKKVVADKIIASIGDKIILKSDIDNTIYDMERQNQEVPPNANCLLLEQALGLKALVVQAERDSIPVNDAQVDGDLDNRIRYFISQYGSKEVLEQISGKSIFQFREDFRPALADQDLAKSARAKIVENVRITPKEVQEYFDSIPKDKLPFYESEMEIGEIVIYPKPGRDLETYAMDQLKEYKKEVEAGTKRFEVLASLYTDDPGSKQTGGLYEINRNEKQWDPIFLAKAFTLKDGQVSSVFKGKHGYHIIQMVSRRGDDATIRHILKIPQVSSIEISQAVEKLDSVRNLLVDGKIQFGEAVSKYSEDDNSKFTGGRVTAPDGGTVVTIDQLDKDLVLMLKNLKIGEYSKAAEFTDLQGKKGVRIVNIVSKTEPHRENMREDYDRIAQRAIEEKKGEALEAWFQKSIPTFYIKISPEYKACPEMEKWNPVEIATAGN